MLATATGWTFEEVGRHTLHDVVDLMRYWERYPPTHLALKRLASLVAAAFGAKEPAGAGGAVRPTDADLKALETAMRPAR